MRRILCGLVLVLALLGITACGGSESNDLNSTTAPTVSEIEKQVERFIDAHPAAGTLQGIKAVSLDNFMCAYRAPNPLVIKQGGIVEYDGSLVDVSGISTFDSANQEKHLFSSVQVRGAHAASFSKRALSLIVSTTETSTYRQYDDVVNLTSGMIRRGVILHTSNFIDDGWIDKIEVCFRR